MNWAFKFLNSVIIQNRIPITPYQIKSHFPHQCCVEIIDESYDTCSIQEMMDLTKTFPMAYTKYKGDKWYIRALRFLFRFKPEVQDCDNYAFAFKVYVNAIAGNMAIGIVHVTTETGKHSLNFFIDKLNQFWYIESQSGECYIKDSYNVKSYQPYWSVF